MSRASERSPKEKGHSHGEHDHPGLSVAVEKKPGKAEVRFTITKDELERARGQEFAALSKRVALKGFRPGKTPRALLERHFAGEVDRHVAEHFVQHAYQQAVDEHGLRPAAYPRVTLDDNLPGKEDWSLAFEILLRPEVELGTIDGLEIEGRPTAVAEEEVERKIADLRRDLSRVEQAGDEPLAPEGLAVAQLEFFRPGAGESCLSRDGIRLAPREPPGGIDPAQYESTLVGMRAGETREVEMVFPPNFPVEEARGERGRLRIRIGEVLRVVPPRDEELQRATATSDEASFRAAVRTSLEAEKRENEEARIEVELLHRVLDAHPLELPPQLVDDQVEATQTELRENLVKQGLSEEEARQRAESDRERARVAAEKGLRAVYLIEEIARARELQVTAEDVSGELAEIARRNGTPPAEVAKYYRDHGLLRHLGLELLERKVRRYLRASAAVRAPG